MSLTRKNMIERMALRTGLTRLECEASLNAIIEIMTQAHLLNEPINLTGVGKFTVVELPAGQTIKHTPCKKLLSTLNGPHDN